MLHVQELKISAQCHVTVLFFPLSVNLMYASFLDHFMLESETASHLFFTLSNYYTCYSLPSSMCFTWQDLHAPVREVSNTVPMCTVMKFVGSQGILCKLVPHHVWLRGGGKKKTNHVKFNVQTERKNLVYGLIRNNTNLTTLFVV